MIEAKKKLENRIWNTKKTRMNTEERLVKTNKTLQWLMLEYTLLITFLSVFSLIITNIIWINYFIVVSSITITVLSIYINSQNYIQRANEMRINYTKLGELEFELLIIKDDEVSASKIIEINNKYQELLRNIENHIESDYQKLNKTPPCKFFIKIWFIKTLVFFTFVLPLLGCYAIVKIHL